MKARSSRRITLWLPTSLVEWIDQRARATGSSRSKIVADAVEDMRRQDIDTLAAEGYRFYSGEAVEFADASAQAVAESWSPWDGSSPGG